MDVGCWEMTCRWCYCNVVPRGFESNLPCKGLSMIDKTTIFSFEITSTYVGLVLKSAWIFFVQFESASYFVPM